ncbi:hypothetical protein [Anaeromyxobacter terrae]|uniref:hypothetical protein n=1 Tax=Anaeromyxobacter terrae TaxID=2925406 RepID=UPI001F5764E5|nr:hypothetical protein [Anaeromyxobacter sp. SG22]
MLLACHSSRLAALLTAALALACKRGGEAAREQAPAEAPATVAQRDGRTPGERSSGLEESRRADRHRRAAARARAIRKIEGTLERNADGRVVIRAPGEESVVLRVGSATAITLDGRAAPLGSLREGTEVRASYESGRGGRPTALTLDARSAPRTGRGAPEGPAPDARWVPNTGERGSDGGG